VNIKSCLRFLKTFLIFKTFIIIIVIIIIMSRANYHEFVNTIAFSWTNILEKLERDKDMCMYNSKLAEERKNEEKKRKRIQCQTRDSDLSLLYLFI